MKSYTFTIKGNHEKSTGNPIPYFRRTQRGWNKGVKRYNEWKDFVRYTFNTQVYKDTAVLRPGYFTDPPIVLASEQAATMELFIVWGNEAHADPDNIFKGIADALFKNDKHLTGSFVATHAAGRPLVQVTITVFDPPATVEAGKRRRVKKGLVEPLK